MSEQGARSALSAAGMERRERMLADLQAAMRRRVVARRAARAGGVGGVAVLAVVAVWVGMHQGAPGAAGPGVVAPAAEGPAVAGVDGDATTAPVLPRPEPARRMIRVVTTDAARMEKYVASSRPVQAALLDDDELMEKLRLTGEVYGLVRTGSMTSVVCYSCEPGRGAPVGEGGGAGGRQGAPAVPGPQGGGGGGV